jgi:hypothetical protein
LGKVPSLKFSNYNIQDEAQFPELRFEGYTEVIEGSDGKEWVVPKKWAKPIYKSGIMTLLGCPPLQAQPKHQFIVFTSCLEELHGGFLWLDHTYLVDMETMHQVSSLPRMGEDPTDVVLAQCYARRGVPKYGTYRGMRGIIISTIKDPQVQFST